MIRVVIADNDEENRHNFRTFIKTAKKDFSVVKFLEAGKDALAALIESEAELLIADIRFFGASGISVIKKIQAGLPELLMILYGTFNDSAYLEKTAETGSVAYMFKPVKPAELGKNMDRAKQQIEKRLLDNKAKERIITSYKQSLPMFEDRFLINLMHGQIASEIEFMEAVDYFKMNLLPPYRVFVVKIDNFRQISMALEQNEKQLLVFRMQNIVNNMLSRLNNGIAFINHISSVTGLVGGETDIETLYTTLDELKDDINRELKISISIGVGREHQKGLDAQVSYKQAKSALRYRHIVGNYTVIPIEFVEPKNILTYKYPHKKEELLTYSAVVGDLEKTNAYLDSILHALSSVGDLPEKLIPNIIVDIAISINRYVSEQKNIDQSVLDDVFSLKDALRVSSIDEGGLYLRDRLTKLCENIARARNKRELEIIEGIKEYVEINYFENISLIDVGKMFCCVPEYLNSIFVKHAGKTYYDYVVSKRLSVAKKLLVREDVDDNTIAISVGYKDQRFFKSIFLQHEGISTDEFRDLHLRGALKEDA